MTGYEKLILALNDAYKHPCSDLECPGSGGCSTIGCLFVEATMAIEKLSEDLKDCRNEMCLRCGEYTERHLGACDGCRWMVTR